MPSAFSKFDDVGVFRYIKKQVLVFNSEKNTWLLSSNYIISERLDLIKHSYFYEYYTNPMQVKTMASSLIKENSAHAKYVKLY